MCLNLLSSSAVSNQRPNVSHGAVPDGQHPPLTPCARHSPVARCLASQQLLHQPTYAFIPLRHLRGRVLAPRPTQELRVRTLAAFPRLRLHQRGGHHRLGQMSDHARGCKDSQTLSITKEKKLKKRKKNQKEDPSGGPRLDKVGGIISVDNGCGVFLFSSLFFFCKCLNTFTGQLMFLLTAGDKDRS